VTQRGFLPKYDLVSFISFIMERSELKGELGILLKDQYNTKWAFSHAKN